MTRTLSLVLVGLVVTLQGGCVRRMVARPVVTPEPELLMAPVPGIVDDGIVGGVTGGVVGGVPRAEPPEPATQDERVGEFPRSEVRVDAGPPERVPSSSDSSAPTARTRANRAPASVARDVANVVRDETDKTMAPASVAFVAPATLVRDAAGTVVLQLAPASTPPAELEDALRKRFGHATVSDAAVAEMAPRMRASLECDNPCVIKLMNPPEDRAVDFTRGSRWTWSVTPTAASGSDLHLTANLMALLQVQGQQTHYEVGVYEKHLHVQVSYGQQLTDALHFVSAQLAVLSSILGAIVAAVAWWRKRFARPRTAAGFVSPPRPRR